MSHKTFKNLITEMAISGYGDYKPSKEMIGLKSGFIVKNKWIHKGKIVSSMKNSYEIYKFSNTNDYIAGNFVNLDEEEVKFKVVFSIELSKRNFMKINNLMNVDRVEVKDSLRGDGIASEMYKFLVKKEKYTILGDEIQYFGARKLWKRLSKNIDVIVDIIDISKDIIIEQNVTLHHGSEDWDFDTRVWDYTNSKKDIRLILRDII